VGEVGFDLAVMQILKKYKTSYILKSTNANSISMVIWEEFKNHILIKELKTDYKEVTVKKVAVISIIGSNIAKPGVLAKATAVLAKNRINVDCISQSLRQVNMQFVISRKQYRKAICVLNDILCVETKSAESDKL